MIVERRQGVGTHASLIVDWHPHHAIASEPEQAKRFEHTDVHFLANDDGDGRRPKQAAGVDVPALTREEGVQGSRQRREVRDRRACHEPCPAAVRQPEHVEHPLRRDFFESRRGRRLDDAAGILIPCAGEPVRRKRRWQ